jgi:ubiquinone/menaquinone biosynthesis C-methylase UbiE/uncharacterized protein YbaR (Trm112 family)
VYSDLLPHLGCPTCHQPLGLQQPHLDHSGEIVAGELACPGCAARYPIRDGVADFLGPPKPPTVAQVVNELPPTAWVYERAWRPFALTLLSRERFPYRRELPLVANLTAPDRGGLYLDVACSNGLYARALARTMGTASGHVAGVDHSLPFLDQARRYARAAGLRISYLRAKAQALPIVGGAAAGVVVGGSLNEIVDLDGCLGEARRVLGRDGRFLAMTLARAATSGGRVFQRLMGVGGVEFWSPDELAGHMARHHLRTVGHWTYGLVMFHLALPA